jgi:hypothetical protein
MSHGEKMVEQFMDFTQNSWSGNNSLLNTPEGLSVFSHSGNNQWFDYIPKPRITVLKPAVIPIGPLCLFEWAMYQPDG